MKLRTEFLFKLMIIVWVGVQAESLPSDGLILWLKPESLTDRDGSDVTRWRDSSPAKNDAIQFGSFPGPVIRKRQANDYSAAMFEKSGQRLKMPQLNLPYETTVFIVAFDQPQRKVDGSVHHSILAADNSPYRMDGNGYGIGYAAGEYDGAMVILSDGKIWQHLRDLYTQSSRHAWEVLTFHKKGDQGEFLRDGYRRDSRLFDRPADAPYHTGYLLGGDVSGRDYAGGIAEVIVYQRGLEPEEIRQVHAYLSKKYDISIADQAKLSSTDSRFFQKGTLMIKDDYADQPYIVQRTELEWVAVVTTSAEEENSKQRKMDILRSTDAGKTWAKASVLEPLNETRQPSWGTLLKTPTGRIYCFYNLNRLPSEGKGVHFVYRFSDDGGIQWSERFILPVRETWHNKQFNSFNFWGIDPPLVVGDTVYIAFSKYGPNDSGRQGEGFFFKSDTLFSATDPAEIRWEMLPEGDHGLVSSRVGTLQEEHNIESLGGDSLYCAFRTLQGYVGEAYSRDGGETWAEPDFAQYVNGRKIKNTRACCMVWHCANGKYLLWFHNNDGRETKERNKSRNPAWLSGGVLVDGKIQWSQPEPALFTFAPAFNSGLSYPDLVEYAGKYFISVTDKEEARLCEIDRTLLSNLWNQDALNEIPQKSLLGDGQAFLPNLDDGGFTITCSGLPKSGMIWSALDHQGNGVAVRRADDGRAVVEFKDRHMAKPHSWDTDEPVRDDSVVSFIFDGAANWIYVVVDGVLCDGGEARQFGWAPIPYQMKELTQSAIVPVSHASKTWLHNRMLSVSETIGMHRAVK
jgi:hypothetical protein